MNLKQARKVLGLDDAPADIDERTVRRAYATLAKTYRPDTHPEEFGRIRCAYELVLESVASAPVPSSSAESTASPVTDYGAPNAQSEPVQLNDKAVSYVMMAKELGSVEEDVPKDNPLQALENEFVQAVKDLKPSDTEAGNRVVQLMDEYLAASARHSRALRDYVERFFIGTCLGDYYLPHAVRERSADFSGLGNSVVVEHRLKPWEREFLLRFDESEILKELLAQANTRGNPAETSLVHGAKYSKVFMHRLDSTQVSNINRWIHWLDETFGADAGYVHDEFRYRWQRLKQVEPLNAFFLFLFTAFMAMSGLVLNYLGAPLGQLFQLPVKSLALTVLGLAALSWANFLLVILMRPVYREIQYRVMVYTLAHFSKPLLVAECLAMLLLIWGSLFSNGASSWGSPVVIVSGMVFFVLAFASRAGGWLDRLPFTQLALRVGIYYLLINIVFILVNNHFANTLWLLLGMIVLSLRSRPMMHWTHKDTSDTTKGVFALRRQQATYSIKGIRIAMAMVGLVSLAMMTVQKFVLDAPMTPILSAIITATLLCFVAIELALNGGIHTHHGPKTPSHQRVMRVGLFVVIGLLVIRLQGLLDMVPSLQACIACYLVLAAWKHFSAGGEAVE